MSNLNAAYKAGVRHLPLDGFPVPTVVTSNVLDGPCECLIRELPVLPLRGLDRQSAYEHGIAMRYIGFVLDKESQLPEVARKLHQDLYEATAAHMKRFRAGRCGPHTVEALIANFLKCYRSASLPDDELRKGIKAYVHGVVWQYRKVASTGKSVSAEAVLAEMKAQLCE